MYTFFTVSGIINLGVDISMSLKENIKKIRKEKKISQKVLAEKSGLSFSFVSKLESGEQANPSLDTIEKIANALEVQVYELLGWNEIFRSIQNDVDTIKDSPATQVDDILEKLLTSEAGTKIFEINHEAVSPDEFDVIKMEIVNFIKYQFSRFKDKPNIYHM